MCVPDRMHHNLASKVEQEPLSFEGAGRARPFRSSILLVSRSCSVFPLRKPTGIGHRNLLPVPIPSTLKSIITRIIGRSYWQRFPDLRDPGQDRRSRYRCYKSKKGTHLFQYQIKLIRDSKSVQTNCVRVRHIVLNHTETDTKRSKFIVRKLQHIWSTCNLCRSAQSCLF